MKVLDAGFVKGFLFVWPTTVGSRAGMKERRNLTYRIKKEEIDAVRDELKTDSPWTPIGTSVPKLAGEYFLVTGSGKYFRNVILDPPGYNRNY